MGVSDLKKLPEIATLIIENGKGEILAYLRDDKESIPFPNHWDLFGGHVEKGEKPEQALVREVEEELGLQIKDYIFFKKYDCLTGDVKSNVKYVYSCMIDKSIEDLHLYEGQKLAFFKPEEIKDVKFANILKDIVLDYLESKEKNAGTS